MHESSVNFLARNESFLGAQLYPLTSVLSLLLTAVVELRGCNSIWPMEWKLFTAWPFKNRSANLESNRLTWQQVRWAQLHLLNALLAYGGFSRGLGGSSSRLPNVSHRSKPHLCHRFTVKHQSLGRLTSVGDAGVKPQPRSKLAHFRCMCFSVPSARVRLPVLVRDCLFPLKKK